MMNAQTEKILFVDDEENLLKGIKRNLFGKHVIDTATSGVEGLKMLAEHGPYAVVVSDMRMPIMDGVTFLARVHKEYPTSIRVMLTGNSDLGTAVSAVNEGHIFRFINKPCATDLLIKVLDAAIKQYHLIQAERELLEDTFQGGINVLVDILALANPVAFSRATRIKYFSGKLAKVLKLSDIWQYEVAAMLSQIGCVTIPPEILEKVYTNQDLSNEEKEMIAQYPRVGHDLIVNIPRMETVAQIIADQQITREWGDISLQDASVTPQILGAAILKLSIDFDTLLSRGLSRAESFYELKQRSGVYHPDLLEALRKVGLPLMEKTIEMVSVTNLYHGMVLQRDAVTKAGLLLAKKGQEVSATMRVMLENHFLQGNIDKNILVAIPIRTSEKIPKDPTDTNAST